MIEPGRPIKDIEIDSNTSIEKIFEELSQSGGFESVNLSEGLEILTKTILYYFHERGWNYINWGKYMDKNNKLFFFQRIFSNNKKRASK